MNTGKCLSFLVVSCAVLMLMPGCKVVERYAGYSYKAPTAMRNDRAMQFAVDHKMSFKEAYTMALNFNRKKVGNMSVSPAPVGYVVGGEFFFPVRDSDKSPLSGEGFYVNPRTKSVRYGDQVSGKVNLPMGADNTGVKVGLW